MAEAVVDNATKIINGHQKVQYENMEKHISEELLSKYEDVLLKFKDTGFIKILDIGGAGGNFALKLKEYFGDKKCGVTVIDNRTFDTWEKFSGRVAFVETSVDNLDKLYEKETFDLIFANRVFHHFVRNSWKETVDGINSIMKKIHRILKTNGRLCITEHFFDGIVFNKISSKIVYAISSCTFKPVIKMCSMIGVESAGIGVCFLSYNMWNDLLFKNYFIMERLEISKKERIKKWYKKICFLNWRNTLDNIMVIKIK